MKFTGKNKKVHDLALDLEKKGVEVTAGALSSLAMWHVTQRTHLADVYGRLVQKDFINYMNYINDNTTGENPIR